MFYLFSIMFSQWFCMWCGVVQIHSRGVTFISMGFSTVLSQVLLSQAAHAGFLDQELPHENSTHKYVISKFY